MRTTLALVFWFLAAQAVFGVALPELVFDAPPQSAELVERLREDNREALGHMMEVLGLEDAGPPIRVLLAQNDSPAAQRAPSWGVGYAIGAIGQVVLLVDRVPGYPYHSLDNVFRHEIAHVLISRAAARHEVPRWFNEGLAIYAARDYWGFDDRGRVMIATLREGSLSLGLLDRHFHAGSTSAARAYALSAAFVRDLAQRHDEEVFARILRRMRQGEAFDEAFYRATGSTLNLAEATFWRHLDLWNRWVPFITSSATLWILVTVLALLAFKRRRERDAAQIERWDEEEQRWLESETTDGWVN